MEFTMCRWFYIVLIFVAICLNKATAASCSAGNESICFFNPWVKIAKTPVSNGMQIIGSEKLAHYDKGAETFAAVRFPFAVTSLTDNTIIEYRLELEHSNHSCEVQGKAANTLINIDTEKSPVTLTVTIDNKVYYLNDPDSDITGDTSKKNLELTIQFPIITRLQDPQICSGQVRLVAKSLAL